MTVTTISLVLFFSTVLGVLPVLAIRRLEPTTRSLIEGVCAGAMLAASWLSLLAPALDLASHTEPKRPTQYLVIAAIIIGYLGLQVLHNHLPHSHISKGDEGPAAPGLARTWLITIAIGLHNIPEGFAVGVGSHQSSVDATSLLAAIAFQNFPEGLIVALALRTAGMRFGPAVFITALTAVIEVLGAWSGIYAFTLLEALLPYGLAVASGAMIFVVCREMIPECQRCDEARGSLGILGGICVVLVLRVLFS